MELKSVWSSRSSGSEPTPRDAAETSPELCCESVDDDRPGYEEPTDTLHWVAHDPNGWILQPKRRERRVPWLGRGERTCPMSGRDGERAARTPACRVGKSWKEEVARKEVRRGPLGRSSLSPKSESLSAGLIRRPDAARRVPSTLALQCRRAVRPVVLACLVLPDSGNPLESPAGGEMPLGGGVRGRVVG